MAASQPSSPASAELWLIRTTENRLTGPFPRAEVCRLILAGELGPQDEVCRAGHYWFALHEVEECRQQLGIQPQFQKATGASGADDEITETQTELGTDSSNAASDIPDLPADLVSEAEQGTAIIRRAKKPLRSATSPASSSNSPGHASLKSTPNAPLKVSVRGISVERPSIWRGAAWVLVLTAGLLVYSVLKILKT